MQDKRQVTFPLQFWKSKIDFFPKMKRFTAKQLTHCEIQKLS